MSICTFSTVKIKQLLRGTETVSTCIIEHKLMAAQAASTNTFSAENIGLLHFQFYNGSDV